MTNLVDWVENSYIPCELVKSFKQWQGNLSLDIPLNICLVGYDTCNRPLRLLAQSVSFYKTTNQEGENILKVVLKFPQMRSSMRIGDKEGKFMWTDPDTLVMDIVYYDYLLPGMVTTKCTYSLI